MRASLTAALLTTTALLTACASVDVTRINDKNRDTAKGFRYYLPRHHLVVRSPHFVGGNDFLVPAIVKDGQFQVVEISSALKADLEAAGVALAFSREEILVSPELAASAKPLQREAETQASTPGTTQPPPPPPAAASDAMLTGSKVDPATLPKDQKTFLVTAKVAKNTTTAPIQITDPAAVVVGLIPFDQDGNPKPAGFVNLEGLPASTTPWKTDADGTYVATGSREALPAPGSYAIALRFAGAVGAVAGNPLILHQATPSFAVVGPTGKPSAPPAEPKDPGKGKESSGQAEYGGTKGLLATSGDPDTNPYQKLDNGLFDIIFLPDLEEQYAVHIHGGLGTAGLQLGLENGWQLERATAQIDNTELGKFIYRNIDKFTDIAAIALKASINPALAGLPAESEAAQQSSKDGTRATLRVTYALEAQPGVYPFLKMSEVKARQQPVTVDKASNASSRFLFLAWPPDTRVSYNVRRVLAVQLVSLTPAKAPDEQPKGCAEGTTAIPAQQQTQLAKEGVLAALKAVQGVTDDQATAAGSAVIGYGKKGNTLVVCVKTQDQEKLTTLKKLADLKAEQIPDVIRKMTFDKIEVVVQ